MAFPPFSLQRSLADAARLSLPQATLPAEPADIRHGRFRAPAIAGWPGLSMPAGRLAACTSGNGDESGKDRGRTRPTIPDEPAESLLQIPPFSRPVVFLAATLPSGGHPTAGRTGRAAPLARQAGTIVCGEKQPRWRMSSREWLHP